MLPDYHDILDPTLAFQLWDYSPSLNRLLLRARRNLDTTGITPMVDLIFFGVRYINIPIRLHCQFMKPTDDEKRLHQQYDLSINRLFVLFNEGIRYYVVAVSVIAQNHTGDLFESPFDM